MRWSCDSAGLDGAGGYVILSTERFAYSVHRDYLVGNASLFDPVGTQTHSVQVYLSANNNISASDTLIQTHTFNYDFGTIDSTRVTVASPPVIPADTPSGTYWIGVITESFDASSGNNDTDGRDAFQITVDGCRVAFTPFGVGLPGSGGFAPFLFGTGSSCLPGGHTIQLAGAIGGTIGSLWVSTASTDIYPVFGVHFYINFSGASSVFTLPIAGASGVPGAPMALTDPALELCQHARRLDQAV
jgi:hypothetical protein